jgi:acyl-CoA synthetase (AMP-forming)/AMP-acid ligase II
MSNANQDAENRRRNLGFFFDGALARSPDKVAIIDLYAGREQASTYSMLDARVDAVARLLARLGVVPGERVGWSATASSTGQRTRFVIQCL